MTRKKNKKKRRAGNYRNPNAPKVRIQLALASTDLGESSNLIKPAIMYGDDVTVFSPVASLITAVSSVTDVEDRKERFQLIFDLAEQVPQLQERLTMSDATRKGILKFAALKSQEKERLARRHGVDLSELNGRIDAMDEIWETHFHSAVEEAQARLGAADLFVAARANVLRVDSLSLGSTPTLALAESLRLATGDTEGEPLDDVMSQFLARLVQMTSEPKTFPLFDADATGLVQALQPSAAREASNLLRGTEVSTAASLMSFLPHFVDMPMDEVIDLRRALAVPLRRFRGEAGRMSRAFENRQMTPGFEFEVEDAWRLQVEPALADIREAMAEHGLLRETASIALGDPRRLAFEAGSVIAAAHGEVVSLSALMTTAVAAGVPLADAVGRAAHNSAMGKRKARKHAFYFLHAASRA